MFTRKIKKNVAIDLVEVCERIAVLETKINAVLWLFGIITPVLIGILFKLLT
jgi:hypothetical protein